MADIAASNVTVQRAVSVGGVTGKDHVQVLAKVVLGAQGTTTNKITAAALGLKKVESCSNAVKDDNTKVYPAVPTADGTAVLLVDLTNATDANRANPADITATIYITVRGYR